MENYIFYLSDSNQYVRKLIHHPYDTSDFQEKFSATQKTLRNTLLAFASAILLTNLILSHQPASQVQTFGNLFGWDYGAEGRAIADKQESNVGVRVI